MAQYEPTNTVEAVTMIMQGMAMGLVFVVFSLLSVQVGTSTLSLMFLPAAIIVFWPAETSVSWSYIGIFALGLLTDIVSQGPLGLWALTLLSAFLVLNDYVGAPQRLGLKWGMFALTVILCGFSLALTGRVLLGVWPEFVPLLVNAVLAIFVFPLLYWAMRVMTLRSGKTNKKTRS